MPQSENKLPDEFSKTKRKNDMLALQAIGKVLMCMPSFQFDKLELPDKLREAIRHGQTLKSHEAKRRHMQYIGKLMRQIDAETLQNLQAFLKKNK